MWHNQSQTRQTVYSRWPQEGHVNEVGHLSKTYLNLLEIHEIALVDIFESKQQNYVQIWHM